MQALGVKVKLILLISFFYAKSVAIEAFNIYICMFLGGTVGSLYLFLIELLEI